MPLKVMDVWVKRVNEFPQSAVDHFSNHFREPYGDHPWLVRVFRSISVEDNTNLTVSFLLSEIDRAIALCDGNKIPDPDGFNLSFLRDFVPSSKKTLV